MVVSSVSVPIKQTETVREAELCPDNQWGLVPVSSLCSAYFTHCSFPVYLTSSASLALEHVPLLLQPL